LPNEAKDSDIKTLFDPFGSVISARVMTKPDGTSKGYGKLKLVKIKGLFLLINLMRLKKQWRP
jgi:RNA recognition motif-containing protein